MREAEGSNHSTMRVYFFSDMGGFETYLLSINNLSAYIQIMNTFSDFYFRTYSAQTWSFEHFFCLFSYFLIFALPFYFAFAGSNFWFDPLYSQLAISYTYTGFYALEVSYIEGGASSLLQYSNVPNSAMNSLIGASFTITQEETSSQINVQLTGYDSRAIQSINLMVFYDVEIPELAKVYSSGVAFCLEGDTSQASISGRLAISVGEPLNGLTVMDSPTVNSPIYYDNNMRGPSTYKDLAESYVGSKLKLQSDMHVSSVKATSATRTISISLVKDTSVVLPYYPSILETLKLKFSKYFGFLILAYLIFRQLLVMLIEEEGLECHQRDEALAVKRM